jgi:hypothetical protein
LGDPLGMSLLLGYVVSWTLAICEVKG